MRTLLPLGSLALLPSQRAKMPRTLPVDTQQRRPVRQIRIPQLLLLPVR